MPSNKKEVKRIADEKNAAPVDSTEKHEAESQASPAPTVKETEKTGPGPEAPQEVPPVPDNVVEVPAGKLEEIMAAQKAAKRAAAKEAAAKATEQSPPQKEAKAAGPKEPEKPKEPEQPKRRGRQPKAQTEPPAKQDKTPEKAPKPKKAEKAAPADKSGKVPKPAKSEPEVAAPAQPEPPAPAEAPRPAKDEQIVYIKLTDLYAFKDHPFQVRNDDEMKAMVSSVRDKGVTQPAIVRPRDGGGFEIVSGHRRQKASELAGFMDMPCIVRNLTDEQAITQMVADNTNHRENIVAERNKLTVKQVQRYIKLTDLVPDLTKLMDEGKIKFTLAVELAYIKPKNQRYIAVDIESQQSSPSLSQAQRMRGLDQKGILNGDVIDGIMMEDKKEVDKVILTGAELGKYFGKEATPREMKD